jgi:diadenosine tetraphosphate (Ap4A) HIT family hydrolase
MFTLHPTLAADTIEITHWDVCRVLLMNDANYPWLILVPARDGLNGLHEVSEEDQPRVMKEITQASAALSNLYNPERMNVAALGNMVPQLHIHIIARFKDDPAWPGPVWGVVPGREYEDEALLETTTKLQAALNGISI